MPHIAVEFSNACIIQDKFTLKKIDKGSLHNALIGDTDFIPTVCHSSVHKHINSFDIWHARFGHPSFKRLYVLRDSLHFDSAGYKDHICPVCPLAKQKRLSFTSHNNMATHAFDVVHADV